MQPHQQRVIEEKAELDERLSKLKAFAGTETFASLSEAERARLNCQGLFMAGYSAVLGERIAAFGSEPTEPERKRYTESDIDDLRWATDIASLLDDIKVRARMKGGSEVRSSFSVRLNQQDRLAPQEVSRLAVAAVLRAANGEEA